MIFQALDAMASVRGMMGIDGDGTVMAPQGRKSSIQ